MFYRTHLKVVSIWMKNRLLLLGSELPSTRFPPTFYSTPPPPAPVSFYPVNLLLLILHVLWLPFSPSAPQCSVKITTICFRKRSHNMSGSSTLATPTSPYFTFTSTWHQAHIAWGSLLSVSSPYPSIRFIIHGSWLISLSLYIFIPHFSLHLHILPTK